MVGYNQDMLKQKAKQYGFQGEMTDFPKYLQQNAKLSAQFIKEQNQSTDTTPQFQTGGVVAPAVVYPPGVENPYAPPPQYLSQPMPPPNWVPDPNLPGYKQMQGWADENWEKNSGQHRRTQWPNQQTVLLVLPLPFLLQLQLLHKEFLVLFRVTYLHPLLLQDNCLM